MPPEKSAYALARYSRSPDSIRDSVEWVRTHDSTKFLESFYFQYGHASIADLGHVVMCFEGVSELAATEIEDEQLWDGQARSSRYQDFSKSGFVTPPELDADAGGSSIATAGEGCLRAYHQIHRRMVEHLTERLPRPEDMKPDAYQRNIAARAFDVARYTAVLGHSDRRGPGDQHPHAGEADPPLEGVRNIRRSASWRMKSPRRAPGRPSAPGIRRLRWSQLRPRWRATWMPIGTRRSRRRTWSNGRSENLSSVAPRSADMVELTRTDNAHAEVGGDAALSGHQTPFRELYEMALRLVARREGMR